MLFRSALVAQASLSAQDNYEIQVYSAETTPPRATMIELHSNFTVSGSRQIEDGVLPTNHAWHETLEITQGFTPWFETGFYIFTSARSGQGWQFVGTHVRPRFRVPERWKWPVGVSLSNEIGYQRRQFATTTWSWEIRPILDKKMGKVYLSFNPTFDHALQGPETDRGFAFSPNFKVSYDFTKKVAGGLEYYGAYGPVGSVDAFRDQQQQFIPVIDLDVSPKWEFNFGVGVGVTRSTDHLLIKAIVGRRFGRSHP